MDTDRLNWQESLVNTFDEFFAQVIDLAPQILGAVVLLVIGWVVAHALRVIARKLVRGFDSLFQRAAGADGAKQEKMKKSYADIVGKTVFWTVIVFFTAAAGSILGWRMFSAWMSNVIIYLPNLIMGLLIILMGFLLGNGVKVAVLRAASSADMEQGELLARVAQIVILFSALVIGIEQIGIHVGFLTNLLMVLVGVLLLGGALAFGSGAKTLVANIIGAQYVRKHCRIGERMKMGDIEGNVVEVTQTSIVLDTPNGRTIIPAKHFQERISSFQSNLEGTEEPAGGSPEKEA